MYLYHDSEFSTTGDVCEYRGLVCEFLYCTLATNIREALESGGAGILDTLALIAAVVFI
jgi:hypothetical protein